MPFKNLTQQVTPTTCIGDSLDTFNSNFNNLDLSLGTKPTLVSSKNAKILNTVSEQEDFKTKIQTTNNFSKYFSVKDIDSSGHGVYTEKIIVTPQEDTNWYFDVYNNITLKQSKRTANVCNVAVMLSSGSGINYGLPENSKYLNLNPLLSSNYFFGTEPYLSFSTFAVTKNLPKITVYWTAEGSMDEVLFATNAPRSFVDSSLQESTKNLPPLTSTLISPPDQSAIQSDGPIHVMCQSVTHSNVVYVGGSFNKSFTSNGARVNSKFYAIEMDKGDYWPTGENDPILSDDNRYLTITNDVVRNKNKGVGYTGRINDEFNLFKKASLDFGTKGAINTILDTQDFLIVGGSYSNIKVGRGLTILNKGTLQAYPFFVNGEIRSAVITNETIANVSTPFLYVVGKFDYINYGDTTVSRSTGLRTYSNNIAKINLSLLLKVPQSSLNANFGTQTHETFTRSECINSIEIFNNRIYIGGNFEVLFDTTLVAKSLCIITPTGTLDTSWFPIVLGEVLTLKMDRSSTTQNYLYVGGDFEGYYTSQEYYDKPRLSESFDNINEQSLYIGDVNDATNGLLVADSNSPITLGQKAHNAICFQITTAGAVYQSRWKPRFNGPVSNFCFHNSDAGSYVYCTGEFTNVNGRGAGHVAVVEKSFNNLKTGSLKGWRVHLDKASPRYTTGGMLMWNNTLLIGGAFRSINSSPRLYLARVARFEDWLAINNPGGVIFKAGANIASQGSMMGVDANGVVATPTEVVVDYPAELGVINETELFVPSYDIQGMQAGDLLYFYIKRLTSTNGLTKTFNKPIYIVGWKVDFN